MTKLELLLKAAEDAGHDVENALLGVLADRLEEVSEGGKEDAVIAAGLRTRCHEWEDVSHHGSPDYECMFCNAGRRRGDANEYGPCVHGGIGWVRKLRYRVDAERGELARILAAEARARYLKAKYEE